MTAAEYNDWINKMLNHLAKLLCAPERIFEYQDGICAQEDVFHRIVSNPDGDCAVLSANCDQNVAWRYLTDRTLDEVVKNIQLERKDGRFYDYSRSTWHTSESLAESIYDRINSRIFIDGEGFFGFRFQDVTDISEMTYEGETAYGSLLFLPNGMSKNSTALLKDGIKLVQGLKQDAVLFEHSQLKYIRKLLVGVGKSSRHKQDRQGLVFVQKSSREKHRCVGYIPEKKADRFPVKAQINGHGKWILNLAGQDVLQVKGRQVFLPRNPIEESRDALKAELQIYSKSEQQPNGLPSFDQYETFIKMLSRQQHGTSAVFLDMKNIEVARWMNNLENCCRAQRIEPWSVLDMDPDDNRAGAVGGISRIDGCFIVDYPRGELVFVNVIVDGIALVNGSLASGSRRNSIPCFLANLVDKCPDVKAVAFLFSEDGDLTVIRGSELVRQMDQKVSGASTVQPGNMGSALNP